LSNSRTFEFLDQLVENLAVLLGEVEEQALHPGFWLWCTRSHLDSASAGLLESTVAADHEQSLDQWKQNGSDVDHVTSLANSAKAEAQVLPKLFKGGTLGKCGQDVFLKLRINRASGVLLAHLTLGIKQVVQSNKHLEKSALLRARRRELGKSHALKVDASLSSTNLTSKVLKVSDDALTELLGLTDELLAKDLLGTRNSTEMLDDV
jgi:hypothetical protein